MDNLIKCQPKCQKCEQNVFLLVMLIKQSYRIGQKSDILISDKWLFAGCVFPM